jgi:KTSC domain
MKIACIALLVICASTGARAECVPIKYRDTCVPLEKLGCKNTVSSFVNEVCYDAKNSYMVILLKTTWYHYCGIPQETVTALESGDVGRYYNSQVKGKFGCQGQPVPNY